MKFTSVIGSLFALALISASEAASAQPYYPSGPPGSINDSGIHLRQSDLSLMAWLPWYYGFGVGAEVRYEIPILPDGFIPSINDEFSIEPSFGLAYSSYGVTGYSFSITDLTPALYGLWSFYFSDPFRLYVGLGLGYNIGIYSANNSYGNIAASFFYWDLCAGVSYKLSPNFGLRGEVGSQGLKGGVSLYF